MSISRTDNIFIAIAFSAGSKCQLSCADEDEEVTIPEITCQEDGNWNFEISDLQCSKKKIEIYPTSIPIESSSDSLTADDEDSEKSVGAAGIAIPLIVLIIIGGGLAYFFLVYKKRNRGGRKRRDIVSSGFDAAKGGDELDNLIDKRPINVSRNSGRHSTLLPNSAIPEDKLEAEIERRFAEDEKIVKNEYDQIPTTNGNPPSASCQVASKNANANKNRYKNILPYDSDRVLLNEQPGDPFSDYINASYIDGFDQSREFIAAQGPTITTVGDFWRMIWEQRVEIIVMVTNIKEGMDEKCQQYWSDGIGEDFEGFECHVTLLHVMEAADYTIREFQITHQLTNQERTVHQFHYTSWPDFDVPRENPIAILKFIRKIRLLKDQIGSNSPILVHCSAGCGRTGTFITVDAMLKSLERENKVDVPKFVYQ